MSIPPSDEWAFAGPTAAYSKPNPDGSWGAPPPPPAAPKKRGSFIASSLILLILAASAGVAYLQRDNIRDVITVWTFEPSPAVVGYMSRASMTERGAFLLEASQPRVADAATFNEECASLEEGTGVLGCYQPGPRTILLFDVTDERLDGVEEVVAAHEMLHAAWDRMSSDERIALAPLLEAEAAARADDAEFTERMEVYARTEPGERLNELHSIVGTEFAEISTELEEYFAEYFIDRSAVTALHAQSDGVLKTLQKQTNGLVAELEKLAASIESDYADYNAGYDALDGDIQAFNDRAASGAFSSEAQFEAERALLLSRQAALDALYADIDRRQQTYDAKLAQLEKLNAQAAALNAGLNITPRSGNLG